MRLFRPDGFLWKALDIVSDIFILSTLWIVCCLPVITAGSATEALYDCAAHCIRHREGRTIQRFFRTFKSDAKISVPVGILWLVILAAGLFFSFSLKEMRTLSRANEIAFVIYSVFLVLPFGAGMWVFPILSRTETNFRDLHLNAFRIALSSLPRTVMLVLLISVSAEACIKYLFPVFIAPALTVLAASLFIEPVLEKLGAGIRTDDMEDYGEKETK